MSGASTVDSAVDNAVYKCQHHPTSTLLLQPPQQSHPPRQHLQREGCTSHPNDRNNDNSSVDPRRSLLEAVDPTATRLFIQGPKQCGLSSILLDLAVSLATQEPPKQREEETSSKSNNHQHDDTAVLLIRPARGPCPKPSSTTHTATAAEPQMHDPFPMQCQRFSCLSNHSNLKEEDVRAVLESSSSSTAPDHQIFRRIQVYHVSHLRDLIATLLQVQGWETSKQPWGGILVDDLDQIVHGGVSFDLDNNNGGGTSRTSSLSSASSSRLTQLLALLVDTVQVLQIRKEQYYVQQQQQQQDLTDWDDPVVPSQIRLAVALHSSVMHSQTARGKNTSRAEWKNHLTLFWSPTCFELSHTPKSMMTVPPRSPPYEHLRRMILEHIHHHHHHHHASDGVNYYACRKIRNEEGSMHVTQSIEYMVLRSNHREDGRILWLDSLPFDKIHSPAAVNSNR